MNKIILIVLAILIIGTGAYLVTKNDTMDTVPAATIVDTTPVPVTPIENPTPATTDTTPSVSWLTYTNADYGFSFQYPSTWKLSEDKTKKSVTIKTVEYSAAVEKNDIDYESITFQATTKAFFTPHLGTKYGEIAYDDKQGAIVDVSSSPVRCLDTSTLLSGLHQITTAIKTIPYSGSLMATPAYSDAAILTKNGSIIIVTENNEPSTKTTASNLITANVKTIANSFTLLGGNTVVTPACSK
ncbi:MAG: PsbP-related protein [Candidatus Paceibacterota bacterium]